MIIPYGGKNSTRILQKTVKIGWAILGTERLPKKRAHIQIPVVKCAGLGAAAAAAYVLLLLLLRQEDLGALLERYRKPSSGQAGE